MAVQSPYYKPSLPFTGPIYGGLRDGQMVVISGSILPSCKRFQVNFQCGMSQAPRSDIAFHFNPRFDDGNCVVANSFERGSWQHEERKNEMPFRKGQAFEIRFLVTNSSFMVAVDGKRFLEFRHRISLFRVDTIGVSGGLDVASISFQSPMVATVWPAASVPMVHSPFPPGPAYLPVPYRVSIMGGIFPSKSIIVEGTPHTGATRFHINLKAGCNTVFHLNPRFNENVIVRNAKFNNSWGSEERFLPSGMPLSRGQPFSIRPHALICSKMWQQLL
uniref:Galectin n=1 Tax=Varanus komodoensis TaxID=61221 RepID=A0A8D2LRT2_VARKO